MKIQSSAEDTLLRAIVMQHCTDNICVGRSQCTSNESFTLEDYSCKNQNWLMVYVLPERLVTIKSQSEEIKR